MANRFNNKNLLIALVALAVLYLMSNFFRNRTRTKTTLKTDIVQIDTAAITEFVINGENEVKFTRNNGEWQISSNGVTDEADKNSVNNILSQLIKVKADRIVTKSKDKWGEYQLTDSTATRVRVTENGKQTLDLFVGRFQYQPPPQGQQQNQFQRQPQIQGSTYVRLGEGDEVYSTEGFLAMTFGQDFNSWRQGQFIQAVKANIRNLKFDYPADSSFVLSRPDSLWMLNGAAVDQSKVDSYLSGLIYKQDKNFADGFSPLGAPTHSLTIAGDNMTDVVVKAFADHENDQYFLQSTVNPGATVESKKTGLFGQLFVDKGNFIGEE